MIALDGLAYGASFDPPTFQRADNRFSVASFLVAPGWLDRAPDTLTDLQRAARFLYLQRISFGGKVAGRTFGLSRERTGRFNLTTLAPDLEALRSRLSGVCVTCLNFGAFIRRVDNADTLFNRERFEDLAAQLRAIKGRFIMSLNDTPGLREVFSDFSIEEINTVYTAASSGPKAASQVLIMNFKGG